MQFPKGYRPQSHPNWRPRGRDRKPRKDTLAAMAARQTNLKYARIGQLRKLLERLGMDDDWLCAAAQEMGIQLRPPGRRY
jgi:hypothetical protein